MPRKPEHFRFPTSPYSTVGTATPLLRLAVKPRSTQSSLDAAGLEVAYQDLLDRLGLQVILDRFLRPNVQTRCGIHSLLDLVGDRLKASHRPAPRRRLVTGEKLDDAAWSVGGDIPRVPGSAATL
jgi:hypothetical protein